MTIKVQDLKWIAHPPGSKPVLHAPVDIVSLLPNVEDDLDIPCENNITKVTLFICLSIFRFQSMLLIFGKCTKIGTEVFENNFRPNI